MNLPVEFWIVASGMTCGAIGFLAAAFFLGLKSHRIEREAWKQARIFYQNKDKES